MKRITLSILVAATLLSSCKENNEEAMDLENYNTEETSYNEELSPSPYNNLERGTYTTDQVNQMADQMRSEVSVDGNNKVSIKNFTAYGELLNQVRNLSVDPETRDDMSTERAYKAFKTFTDEMPAYLQTRMVRKEVEDVKMAMNNLEDCLKNDKADKQQIEKHINKVKNAVEDLNNEIVDVRTSLDRDPSIDFDAYREFVNRVNYDTNYVVTIMEFPEYELITKDRSEMNKAASDQKMSYAQTLISDFNTMLSNMPAYLKIDDVMDAVEDVQKEMKEYQDERKEANTSKDENLENLEEIDEALYDLNKELVKARNKYDSDNKKAIENYMQELNG